MEELMDNMDIIHIKTIDYDQMKSRKCNVSEKSKLTENSEVYRV